MATQTYHFSRFVLSLIDEVFKRLLHHIHKFLVLIETNGDNVVQFVFEICTPHGNKDAIHTGILSVLQQKVKK